MEQRELPQKLFAVRRELDQNLAAILITVPPQNRAAFGQTIDQLHGAVMTEAQPGGKSGYGWASSGRETFQREKELMLLRFKPVGARGFLTEMQEFADAIAEFGKLLEALEREIGLWS